MAIPSFVSKRLDVEMKHLKHRPYAFEIYNNFIYLFTSTC